MGSKKLLPATFHAKPWQSEVLMVLGLLIAAASQDSLAAEAGAEGVRWSGSIRIRQEALDGNYRAGFRDRDNVLSIRSSVHAEWDLGTWRVGGEVADSRAYGTDAGSVLTANDVDTLEPVQAYVAADFGAPFGAGSTATVQAGRFTINLGSRRLVSADEFRNTAQGYTGARADFKFSGRRTATFFYVLPQQHRPDDFASLLDNGVQIDHEGRDQQLFGALLSKAGLPGRMMVEAGFVRFLEHDTAGRPTRNRALSNVTARIMSEPAPGRPDYEIEGIAQSGTVRAGTAASAALLDVRARFVHVDLGYTVPRAWKPHVNLEWDYASGDAPGGRYSRFDTVYGMRRGEFGPSGTYGALGRTNINSWGVRLDGSPTNRLDVMATWKWLWAADRRDSFSTTGIRDATGAAGRFAGRQLDARVRYWLVPKRLRAEVNAVWLMRGNLLKRAPNASPHGDTHYGTAAITLSL